MLLLLESKDFNPEIRQAYEEGRIKGIGMEYQYNGLYGYLDGEEVCIYDFSKHFKIDNRYSNVNLVQSKNFISVKFS